MNKPYEQWVWVERDSNGQEGMIVAEVPGSGLGMIPLCHRKQRIAVDHMEALARQHEERSGNPVRLVHLREVTDQ